MKNICVVCFVAAMSVCQFADAQVVEPAAAVNAFREAERLRQEGKDREAFSRYLAVSGGEYAAVQLARTRAGEFLEVLAKTNGVPAPRAKLVEGDLLLAVGDRRGALAAYRTVAAKIATKPADGWGQGLVPRDEYFVELPSRRGDGYAGDGFGGGQPLEPFSVGPGSHRDNWLIRRFLALQAWDDAASEFERLAELHREATRSHLTTAQFFNEKQQPAVVKQLVRPAGFDGLGLQFFLDYAFFLQQQKEPDRARQRLLEPLLLIDLDHNPNARHDVEPVPADAPATLPVRRTRHPRYGFSSGVSRKEYIRLVYGEFKSAAKEPELNAAIESRIERGENRLRRVLARVRSQQGRPDDAIKLELAYLNAGGFSPLTVAYRRGLIFDEAGKTREAVAEFERVLTLPFAALKLPDAEEEVVDAYAMSQAAMPFRAPLGADRAAFQSEVLTRLQRLYAALGDTDKTLDVTLRQFDLVPQIFGDLAALEAAKRRFAAAGQEPRFNDWAQRRLTAAKEPRGRASLSWLLGDHAGTAQELARAKLPEIESWKQRFRVAGPDKLRLLLKALVAADPRDSRARLELLDLDGEQLGVESVELLELLLESDAEAAFVRGKGARNQTQFTSYFDLAYRLMRLYERQGQGEKLHALGLRIAREAKPFADFDAHRYSFRGQSDAPEYANACLALAIQHADTNERQTSLAEALRNSRWSAGRLQLERRLANEKPQPRAEPFGWANVPADVRLLASNENVLALAHDERYVYAGQPWGVAVYDLAGRPVTRVALGEAARAIVVASGQVWAGTPKGLFRIARDDWSIAHQRLDGDLAESERHSRSFPGVADYWFDNGVYSLALDGDQLWLGLHRNLQVLNTRTLELRAYSFAELKIESWAGFERIVPDGRYVWADSPHIGLRRYDRETDEWSAPKKVGPRDPVRFLGIIDGRVFGSCYLNDTLRHRPCWIDRQTLAVTPLLVDAARGQELINSPLRHFGKLDGQLVFGEEGPGYVWNETTGKLRPIPAVVEQFRERVRQREQEREKEHRRDERLRGALAARDRLNESQRTFGMPWMPDWLTLALPDGTRVLASRQDRTRYEYPHEDRVGDRNELSDHVGGLFFLAPAGDVRRVSSAPRGDVLRADRVHSVVLGTESNWLCTSFGLVAMDRGGNVLRHFSRTDGLCANHVTGGVELGGKTYFATGWGDAGGGVAVFDPRTRVFTSFHQADGLDADKLSSVAADQDGLRLTFDVEYLRHSPGEQRYRQFPPGRFDPASGTFKSGGEPRLMSNEPDAYREKDSWESFPLLGGFVLQRLERDGKQYLAGTRGLLISDARAKPELAVRPLGAKLIPGRLAELLANARRRPPKIASARDLAAALADANPYYRANVLASLRDLSTEFLPAVAGQLVDPVLQVRCTALYHLTQFKDDERVVPLLQARLTDADPYIRAVATQHLARRGRLPPLRALREFLDSADHFSNFPFGASSSIGVIASREGLYEAIAPLATPDVFALLLQQDRPPRLGDWDNTSKVFPQLGQSLTRHPEAAAILLKAHDESPHDALRRDFARDVFRFAGPSLLPKLHEALASPDRVTRSNAARACGAIADRSSIPVLLKSLDLESGLSRASIVWALGELKAEAALPALAKLYIDARHDEQRHAGSGFRHAQAAAAMSAQYDQLRSLNAIAADWDEVKTAAQPRPVDPQRQEDLLQPAHILAAVAQVGPPASQGFYRTLAAERDVTARQEAAVHLAAVPPSDRAKNQPILRNLLADSDPLVRLRAAASLLLLGDMSGQSVLLESLSAENNWEQRHALEQLTRLTDPKQLAFAREPLQKIAANRSLGDPSRSLAAQHLRRFGEK